MREVNRAHILNYQSDSSDLDEEDSDDSIQLPKSQRREPEISANNPWGATKKSFYADDKQVMSSSEEEDEQKEAERLAEIRRKKLAKQIAQRQQDEEEVVQSQSDSKEVSSDSDSDDIDEAVKLGNKLFDSSDNEDYHNKVLNLTNDLELARAMID